MALGNGNPKEGDKGSNFSYDLKVLQGLEAIALGLESGIVQDITVTAPLVSTSGSTPDISIPKADTTVNGYLASEDWNTFNNKQDILVSGDSIRTINGESVLGSGDIIIGSSSPFNAFQYNIIAGSTVVIPTSGNCFIYVSEGEIFQISINKTTLDGLGISQYLTTRLNNTALLVNIPTLSPENFILTLTTLTDIASYVIFNMADPVPIGNQDILFGGGGIGTITFIP